MGGFEVFSDIFHSLNRRTFQFIPHNNGNQLMSVIYSLVESKIGEDWQPNRLKCEFDYAEKVVETRNVMENVIERFEKADEACAVFLDKFEPWAECRKMTVEELNVIAGDIDSDRFKGNISKIVGGIVGVAGGAAIIASVAFPPLLIAGGVAAGISGTTVLGTSVAEVAFLKKRMTKAKTALEVDQELFRHLQEWFERSNDLIEAIERIVGFKIMADIQEELLLFYAQFKDLRSFINDSFMDKLRPLLAILIAKLLESGNLLARFGPDLAAVLISFIVVMFFMPMRDSYLCDRLALIQRLTIGVCGGIGAVSNFRTAAVGVMARKAMTEAVKGAPTVVENVPKVAARSIRVFAGIGMALDVTSIILTSIDIHKGSLSEQGKELKRIAEQLQEEFDFVEQVYNGLKKEVF
ncbi:uncharacterized protein TNCT_107671 [Trichonephila clavata]|uniref:Apolipoprotein L3 n=1 Tax=Trichonephila clavata TaxID=2740835 RepID=A0A8X6HUC5_TRICU|nr:uncharacterized protein TNCT_107671 [Trichonephila clavata]